MSNKRAQIAAGAQFIATLFITSLIYFVLLEPVISPVISTAVEVTPDFTTQILIRLVPFAFLFCMLLVVFKVLRNRG